MLKFFAEKMWVAFAVQIKTIKKEQVIMKNESIC